MIEITRVISEVYFFLYSRIKTLFPNRLNYLQFLHGLSSLFELSILFLDLGQPVGQPCPLDLDVDLAGGHGAKSLDQPHLLSLRRHRVLEDPLATFLNMETK